MSAASSFASRIGLLLGSLLVVLLLAEGVARIVVHAREAADPSADSGWPREELPVLGDVLSLAEPNARGIHQGVLYRTNSHGARGPERTPHPAPGTFRILVAGDSVTVGWAVEEELAYPQVLERLLNESPPAGADGPQRFEVVNVGLAGVNASFSSERLRKYGELYHPDLNVYGFTLNDIEGRHYRRPPVRADKPSHEALWRRVLRFQDSPSVLLREIWPRFVMAREWQVFHRAEAELAATLAASLQENYFENPEAWAELEAALDRQAALAAARGICGHVLIHTHLTQLGPEHPFLPFYERVAEASLARGLSVTETFPRFAGREGSELWVHRFDVHPNAEGHALLAAALYEGLRALPAHCWRGAHSSR